MLHAPGVNSYPDSVLYRYRVQYRCHKPFWAFYGPRDLSQIAASPPLLQPDSRRMAVTITNDQTDEHLLQRFSRAPS
jgi:hypothetical protein